MSNDQYQQRQFFEESGPFPDLEKAFVHKDNFLDHMFTTKGVTVNDVRPDGLSSEWNNDNLK